MTSTECKPLPSEHLKWLARDCASMLDWLSVADDIAYFFYQHNSQVWTGDLFTEHVNVTYVIPTKSQDIKLLKGTGYKNLLFQSNHVFKKLQN